MAAPDAVFEGEEYAAAPNPVHRTRKTAMWVWLGSEAFFFGAMISTFLLYRTTCC